MNESIDLVFDADEIAHRVIELGKTINDELAAEDPLMLSILGGSMIFLADLARAIENPVRFEVIQVGATNEAGVMEIRYPIPLAVRDQSLLLLKDVVTSGVVESYLESQLRGQGAREVRFVALLDRPGERKTDFDPNYRLFSVDDDATYVGYGLKQNGRWGNLPYIGRLANA